MKKATTIVLALVFVLGIATTAFAAPNPFVDVPANHWAYKSVQALYDSGVIKGYGDKRFRGQGTVSRYEMAQIVAQAMANYAKADAALKAQIDKLQVEFADELNKLGVRVAALEKKVSNTKITGDSRFRYRTNLNMTGNDSTASGIDNKRFDFRVRLQFNAPVSDSVDMETRITGQNRVGVMNSDNTQVDSVTADLQFDKMNFTFKNVMGGALTIGRIAPSLGLGLMWDGTGGYDSISYKGTFGKFGLQLGYGDISATQVIAATTGGNTAQGIKRAFMANASYSFDPKLMVTGAALYSGSDDLNQAAANQFAFKSYAFGVKGVMGDFTGTFEYTTNGYDFGAAYQNVQPTGWYAKLKWKGADRNVAGTYGIWVDYRKMGRNSVNGSLSTLNFTNTTDWVPNTAAAMGVNGFAFGFDYAVSKNAVFYLSYEFLRPYDDSLTTYTKYNPNVYAAMFFNF